MLKNPVLLCLLVCFFSVSLKAQDHHLADSLKKNLQNATTDAQKIRWMSELASFYTNLDNPRAEQYQKELLQIAELSRDRRLMVSAYLRCADRYYNHGGIQHHLNRAIEFSNKALELSKSSHLEDLMAWSYIYLARGARNSGENDKALNFSTLALSMAAALEDDSLQVSVYNAVGATYLARNEKLLAFRNYSQALNRAEQMDKLNYDLLQSCYYSLSNFYTDLQDFEKAKDYMFRLQKLTLDFDRPYERLEVYNFLGRIYTLSKQSDIAISFYERAMALADSLNFGIYRLNSYSYILQQYLTNNQGEKALTYFREHRELQDFMVNAGFTYFVDQVYGIAYTKVGQMDSAGYYFKKAQPDFESKANKYNQYWFYYQYGQYYNKKKDYKNALTYWLKARKIGEERGDIELLQTISGNLDSLYQKLGDYKSAYSYNAQFHTYKDSLEKLSTEKDLLLLEVDNENKRRERELALAEEEKRTRHNIQYMGITAAIAGVFIVLVMLGIFSVSQTTIKILGFFAFIFLFEFIILLADNQIHHWTHGEPWKILAIKIGLISILLPLHHYLEEKVIHYLISRKMIEVNTRGLISKLAGKQKADPASVQ